MLFFHDASSRTRPPSSKKSRLTERDRSLYFVPMKAALAIITLFTLLSGCEAKPSEPSPVPMSSPEPAKRAQFGESIKPGDTAPLGTVLSGPAAFAGRNVIVEGAVRQACTRRGCWMELAETLDKSRPGCRVTFKDYGFFVPIDSAGKKARVQGQVQVKTVEAGSVKHMEEEGAHFASKNPDGSANEVRIVATGVELSS
jgi:Domain of unknown function (DUF4920)